MTKRRKSVFGVIGGLTVFQLATYFLVGHASMPVAGLKSLSDFEMVRSSKFVVLGQQNFGEPESPLTAAQQTALEAVFKKYGARVFHSVEEVPENDKIFTPTTTNDVRSYELLKDRADLPAGYLESHRKMIAQGRKLAAFKDGMAFTWKLDRGGPFWMKCTSQHWVSGTGAEWRTDLFIWALGKWIRVHNFRHTMA